MNKVTIDRELLERIDETAICDGTDATISDDLFTQLVAALSAPRQSEGDAISRERVQAEADAFFDWPTADKSSVTTTSCLIFARCIAGMVAAERDATIAELRDRLDVMTQCADNYSRMFEESAEECERLRGECARLESKYERDVWGLNNEGDPIGGDHPSGFANNLLRVTIERDTLRQQRDRLRAENERLRKSCAEVSARSVHETRAATNSTLDGYLAAGIAATDAELDTLRQKIAEIEPALVAKNHEAHDLEIDNRQLRTQLAEARELLTVASEIIHEQAMHIDRPMTDLGSEALTRIDAWLEANHK